MTGTRPWWRALAEWAGRVGLQRKLAILLTVAAIGLGIATYVELTGSPPLGQDPEAVLILLNIDLVVLLLLSALIAKRVVEIWGAHRKRSAGSRLHIRFVVLFSLLAVTPAIVVAVFSALFFNLGVQAWFSERVKTALTESFEVAEAYLNEHQNNIRADVSAMARDLSEEGPMLLVNPERLGRVIETQTALRALSETILFDDGGRVLARGGLGLSIQLEPVPAWALDRARRGEIPVLTSDSGDRVRALARVSPGSDLFLYVGRPVDAQVLAHIDRTRGAVQSYFRLERERSSLQITFVMIFVVVALLLLLAAVWVGLTLATALVTPISRLIDAADDVGRGNLLVRVPEGQDDHELGTLNRTFNRMTGQLRSQQRELIETNRLLDLRRRFTEAVLSGVSAGVIGLDESGRINLPNRTASRLLHTDLDRWIGKPLETAAPELGDLVTLASAEPTGLYQTQTDILRRGKTLSLLVRVSAERDGADVLGYVVTFDDITELVSAQRKAAWADVARRIAHEIKNPLTPIQLAAERLKRKYLKQITTDPEVFTLCTDTIVRQVEDLRRMVNEFSDFARLPAPSMKGEDLAEICREAVFLQSTARPDIAFSSSGLDRPATLICDRQQIARVLTNVLANAVDAIDGRPAPAGGTLPPGRIEIDLGRIDGKPAVTVTDNGRGLPDHLSASKLIEPYVTTREKGTGLGLAIVKKILEDHRADLVLEPRSGPDDAGARARIVFRGEDAAAAAAPDRRPRPVAQPETSGESGSETGIEIEAKAGAGRRETVDRAAMPGGGRNRGSG